MGLSNQWHLLWKTSRVTTEIAPRILCRMIVILFDIDGTLIHSGGAGLAALHCAVREEFGVDEPCHVSLSGRTDRGIARDLFQAHDVPQTEENWRRFRSCYLKHLRQQLPLRNGAVLPGVTSLVTALANRDGVTLGLLTGNVREGASIKLSHYQLQHHFAFGGFGDHHLHRDDVAREALQASRERVGETLRPDRVWVIGDTPLDVSCAKAIGAKSIAVATGSHPRAELSASHPDVVVDDLTDATLLPTLLV